MNRITGILVISVIVLAACGRDTAPPAVSTAVTRQPWVEFTASVVDEYYRRNPAAAVNAGLHEYDGQIPDISSAAMQEYVDWLETTLAGVHYYADLQGFEAFERDYLANELKGQLFWLTVTDYPKKNPLFYDDGLSFSVYVDREYAPIEQRLRSYTQHVSQLPAYLQTMRDNLEPPLPAPYLEIAYGVFSGLKVYLETTVPELFAAVADEQLQRQFREANAAAVEAVLQTADWLESLKATATNDYALGEQRFLQMLRDTQGVDISMAELKAAGNLNLRQNLEALDLACAEFAPGASTRDCVLAAQNRKPAEGAVKAATRQLPMLRKFVEDNDLVTIPGTEDARVAEAPPHRRFNFAYIEIPGPFESGLPSVYRIAPPDPNWSEADQLAYIPGETDLLATSVHEVWPGHFLQFLHANRTKNSIGRHFHTYTFTEGWAHYTEQMMVDAGLGQGDPEVRIGQLLNALLRNVRYLSAIGLHAEGMTVEQSQAMFEDKAYEDFGDANQQAYRGTYDPGYLNYTLGKLMINKLRDDWTQGRGGREAWGRFHDEFLSYGSPPIPLVRRQMLGAGYDGDSALLPKL